MFYIYQYSHPITNIPFYIGKGKNDRKLDHIRHAKNKSCTNKHFENTLKKLWSENLEPLITILSTFYDEQEAYNEEFRLISLIGRKISNNGPLCNITLGGKGPIGRKHTEESKAKMRNKIVSEESKVKMSKSQTGKIQSLETIEKRMIHVRGIPKSEITKERMSKSSIGKSKTKQHRANISKSQFGGPGRNIKNWNVQMPSGEILAVTNLSLFCKSNNLVYKSFLNTIKNKKPMNGFLLI